MIKIEIGKNENEIIIGNVLISLSEEKDNIINRISQFYNDNLITKNSLIGINEVTFFDKTGTLWFDFSDDKLDAIKIDYQGINTGYTYDANPIIKEFNNKCKELYGDPEYSMYDLQNFYNASLLTIGVIKVSQGMYAQILFTNRK